MSHRLFGYGQFPAGRAPRLYGAAMPRQSDPRTNRSEGWRGADVGGDGSGPVGDWQSAELHAAAFLRQVGYPDAEARPGGPDGGIDVKATGAAGQVKHHAAAVGRPLVQRLVGARLVPTDRLFFFAAGGYSRHAIEYADMWHVALFRYDAWGRMSAVNEVARQATSAAVAGGSAQPQPHGRGRRRHRTLQLPRYELTPAGRRQAAALRRKHPFTAWAWRNRFLLFGLFLLVGALTALGATFAPSTAAAPVTAGDRVSSAFGVVVFAFSGALVLCFDRHIRPHARLLRLRMMGSARQAWARRSATRGE